MFQQDVHTAMRRTRVQKLSPEFVIEGSRCFRNIVSRNHSARHTAPAARELKSPPSGMLPAALFCCTADSVDCMEAPETPPRPKLETLEFAAEIFRVAEA